MKIITSGRGSGKTYGLVQRLKGDPDAVLVVATHQQVRTITKEYNVSPDQVVYLGQPNLKYRVSRAKTVLVDELEFILMTVLGAATIDIVTASADVETTVTNPGAVRYGEKMKQFYTQTRGTD